MRWMIALLAVLLVPALASCTTDDTVDVSARFAQVEDDIRVFATDLESEMEPGFRTAWAEFQTEWDALRAEVDAGLADVDTSAVEARLAELDESAGRAGGEFERRWATLGDQIRDALDALRR